MKIRTGFVSNSSSSSFLIVGVNKKGHVKKLMKAEGFYIPESESYYDNDGNEIEIPEGERRFEPGMGRDNGEHLVFLGSYEECVAYYAGVDAEDLLEDGLSLQEIKEKVKEIAREKYGIKIPLQDIGLIYGEAGD